MAWLIAALMIGPILYIVVTLYGSKVLDDSDYSYGRRKLNPSDVADSSMMYGLQIAAITLFATWGYNYGFTSLIVPIFWFIGYLILAATLTDAFLERFISDQSFRTLHGFISGSPSSRVVRAFAAILTLVGLAGPAMVEAFTVGNAIGSALPQYGDTIGAGLALGFIAISLIYMTIGGFPGVVKINQYQMVFGYGGFCVAVCGFMSISTTHQNANIVSLVSVVGAIVNFLILFLKYRHNQSTKVYIETLSSDVGVVKTNDSLGLMSAGIASVSFCACLGYVVYHYPGSILVPLESALPAASFQFGFTILATLSLFVANAAYQLVDVTQWQRLLSLAVAKQGTREAYTMLRRNAVMGGALSSLSWVIAILFGVYLSSESGAKDADPYALFNYVVYKAMSGDSLIDGLLLFVLVAAILAIMFSTLDAIIAATAFTVQEDLLSTPKAVARVAWARLVTVGVVIFQLFLYLILGAAVGDKVSSVLYVCWSFQIAMVPVVCLLLLDRGGGSMSRLASMFAGCAGALVPVLIGKPDLAYEISPVAALLLAGLVYVSFGGLKKLPAGGNYE